MKEIGKENLDSPMKTLENIAREAGKDKSDVLKELNKETNDVPFNVRENISRSADFINFVREGATTWLEFNKDHIYWEKLEGNPTISGEARQYMHFVFYAFYQALITRETINKGEVDKFILDSNFF